MLFADEVGNAIRYYACLPASRPGNDEDRSFRRRYGQALRFVQIFQQLKHVRILPLKRKSGNRFQNQV
jgi:hypothetical protein